MSAAIILCAGKGTRMNDDSKSKVVFKAAGVPVIKRLIDEMRRGGVNRFVIVVGHKAETVKEVLQGEEGVSFAYQYEQKGTGHAAECGVKELLSSGYNGNVIISMGDKIVESSVISDLLKADASCELVNGVVPVEKNIGGGRVVVDNLGKPYGTVELADVCMMAIQSIPKTERESYLKNVGLGTKKAQKVLDGVDFYKGGNCKILCGKAFTPEEILQTPYSNAGLYRFNAVSLEKALKTLGSDNAQGEVYLTDALEYFASRNKACVYVIKNPENVLTYSTKPELTLITEKYLNTAKEFALKITQGEYDQAFLDIYSENIEKQKLRYLKLLNAFVEKYGDKKVIISRAPGRVNVMGTHIDHRGGAINVMTIDNDTVLVVSPRRDDTVNVSNLSYEFKDQTFSISKELSVKKAETWLEYINSPEVISVVNSLKGNWVNYVKASTLRLQYTTENPLCGMDIMADGNIPVAAGLSSSSSIVVAVSEAVCYLNSIELTDKDFVELCGSGEWYVGSRGGAGDHGAMHCSKKGKMTMLRFKPFIIGESVDFPSDLAVIVADSKIQSKKSENSKDKFNAKVMAYEFAFMLIKKQYPNYKLIEFRDIAKNVPKMEIYSVLLSLPEKVTREELISLLPEQKDRLSELFKNHADPGYYDVRGVATFGITECFRAEEFLNALKQKDYDLIGKLIKLSHDGDRVVSPVSVSNETISALIESGADIAYQTGAYGCSTKEIDYLSDLINAQQGVLGSKLTGAGLGGCVVAIVKKENAKNVIDVINKEYYDKFGFSYSAKIYLPACGSKVIW
ncbi:MAG: NTP transferase domain-containing protein [Clostridia bacterium]|nr:NTP transferase domain-containing protein [Clostridia bacterium]